MGRDKALVPIAGRPMARWVAKAAHAIAPKVIAVGRETPIAGIPTVPDVPTSKRGTLTGLVTALLYASPSPVLLLAVDQPFVRTATLRHLVNGSSGRAVVPFDQGARQVACGCYPASLAEAAAQELDRGGSIQTLLDHIDHVELDAEVWTAWGEDGRSWFSVDTDEALAEGLRRYGSPG